MILSGLSQKIKQNRMLYTQILFVALAFLAMVTLSYAFMSIIVRGSLIRNADNVLDVTQTRVTSRLAEFKSSLESFAGETRKMLIRGDTAESLKEYIDDILRFTFLDGSAISGIQDFYGYFETPPAGPALIYSSHQSLPKETKPEETDWYQLAVEAGGNIAETIPVINSSGETVYTYAKCILDDKGRRLGVVCMDIKIDMIGQEVVSTALNQGGYGMLMNQELMTMFHPNPGFIGVYMDNPFMAIHIFADELRSGKVVFERSITSYKNEESLAFFRRLSNGWYLGLITPESQYYAGMNTMAVTLSVLGITLAAVLAGILFRVDKARVKSDDENKKKSMFLANMSHEIRTPLNAVVGLSELALDDNRLDNETEERLEKIHASGMIILSIVNDILDISKLESGRFEIYPAQYDTPSLINDIVSLNIVRIGEKPIVFKLNIDENLPGILYGDDLRVKQIFNNLLSNAFKYTHSGKVEWRVSFERDADNIWLNSSVSDTGIGIKPEDVKKLFSEYNQVDTKANRKVEGTGLGLAIAKRLAEMMDGTITVESEYGKGSTFHVRLRQAFVSGTPIGKTVTENLMSLRYSLSKHTRNMKLNRINLSYAHVLVVDDIPTNLDVAKGMMKLYGLKIDCTTSGQRAVEMIQAGNPRYSAVFMDHMMPGMDGITATRIIREEIGTDYARNIPIIALTANAIVGNEEMFLSHGFQDFISKPIDIAKLDAVLRRWVRNKNLEKEFWSASENAALPNAENRGPENREPLLDDLTINGVDTGRALERFGGDEAVLLGVLRSYIANTPPLINTLRKYLEAEKLEDYAIVVHGLKGSSYGICAQEAGRAAEALETAAKEGDYAMVKTGHPGFEKIADALLEDMKKALIKIDAPTNKPFAAAPDQTLLEELRAACKAFDMDHVDMIMERLESFRYERGEKLIAWLREQVNNMAFEEISGSQWPQE